jgi:uncharacterized protein (TIGR03066 family)
MQRRTKVVLGLTLFALVVLAVWVGFGRSAENKKKLVGTWTLISGGYGTGGYGTGGYGKGGYGRGRRTLEFTADGKMKVAARRGNKTIGYEGTYRIKGDQVEMTTPDDEEGGDSALKQQVVRITSLTDRELIVADEKGRKTAYTRK